MNEGNLFDELSHTSKRSLSVSNIKSPILSATLIAQTTGFNREVFTAPIVTDDSFDELKKEIYIALEALQERIDAVLLERSADESASKRWVYFVGLFIIGLIITSIVLETLTIGNWVTTLFSGVSLAGLLYILYWPVQKIMAIANDRATLRLIPLAFRVRVISAITKEDLQKIALALAGALQRVERDAGPPR